MSCDGCAVQRAKGQTSQSYPLSDFISLVRLPSEHTLLPSLLSPFNISYHSLIRTPSLLPSSKVRLDFPSPPPHPRSSGHPPLE
jgi:hypothetical protein